MSASQYPYDYMTVFMARKDMKVSPCAHFDGGIFYHPQKRRKTKTNYNPYQDDQPRNNAPVHQS